MHIVSIALYGLNMGLCAVSSSGSFPGALCGSGSGSLCRVRVAFPVPGSRSALCQHGRGSSVFRHGSRAARSGRSNWSGQNPEPMPSGRQLAVLSDNAYTRVRCPSL